MLNGANPDLGLDRLADQLLALRNDNRAGSLV
jgi:hypothetical protein